MKNRKTAIVRPDQSADAALGGALGVGERIEFVNQTFGVDPAQAMLADTELAGVVADDHNVGEQAMRLDKRTVAILGVAFGCDANGGAPAQVIVDERSSGLARIGAAVMTN